MKDVSIIGVDLAKQVFQLHGATAGERWRTPDRSGGTHRSIGLDCRER
jgi:hypothetical protein